MYNNVVLINIQYNTYNNNTYNNMDMVWSLFISIFDICMINTNAKYIDSRFYKIHKKIKTLDLFHTKCLRVGYKKQRY